MVIAPPMRLEIQILRVSPWSQFNEYEGEVEAVVEGRPIVEPAAGGFVHRGGVTYEATGRIERVDGERLRLDCGFALDVDLDLSRTQQPLRSRLGADRHVRVFGVMQLSFDLDDPA